MITSVHVVVLAFAAPLIAASVGITPAPSKALSTDATSVKSVASVVDTTSTPFMASTVDTSSTQVVLSNVKMYAPETASEFTSSKSDESTTLAASSVATTSAPLFAVGVKGISTSLAEESVSTSAEVVAASEGVTSTVQSRPTSALHGKAYAKAVSIFRSRVIAMPMNAAPSSFRRVTTTIVHGQTTTAIVQGVAPSHPAHKEAIKPTASPTLVVSGYPGHRTLSIVNKHGPALSMALTSNVGAPTAIGDPKPAALGDSAKVLFPIGWAGLMDIAPILDKSASKIEMSYNNSIYADISYVDGYTVPITCSCGGEIIAGCNVELFNATGPCPDEGPGPICYNPSAFLNDGPTHPFFSPCERASYTYPKDDLGTMGCDSNLITCCVGTECDPNPRQPGEILKAKAKAARARSFSGRISRLTRRHSE
ncbi:hypothetical protein N7G274_007277 [Stereocaulon virgatum]|uniref:Thaumatin-like protein n=1 Tax=Stereocaulon virgatum TaxID=373712 RepID=A0ABR4A533_9LECA